MNDTVGRAASIKGDWESRQAAGVGVVKESSSEPLEARGWLTPRGAHGPHPAHTSGYVVAVRKAWAWEPIRPGFKYCVPVVRPFICCVTLD